MQLLYLSHLEELLASIQLISMRVIGTTFLGFRTKSCRFTGNPFSSGSNGAFRPTHLLFTECEVGAFESCLSSSVRNKSSNSAKDGAFFLMQIYENVIILPPSTCSQKLLQSGEGSARSWASPRCSAVPSAGSQHQHRIAREIRANWRNGRLGRTRTRTANCQTPAAVKCKVFYRNVVLRNTSCHIHWMCLCNSVHLYTWHLLRPSIHFLFLGSFFWSDLRSCEANS